MKKHRTTRYNPKMPTLPLWKIEITDSFPPKVYVYHRGVQVGGLKKFKMGVEGDDIQVNLTYDPLFAPKSQDPSHPAWPVSKDGT